MESDSRILDKYVGHKIRERRKALGLTQIELGEILGLSHQQVQRYETGENTVSMPRMLEIAAKLNVKPSFFYKNAPVRSEVGVRQPGIISRELARPLRLWVVEDCSHDALLLRKALERSTISTEMQHYSSAEQALDALRRAGETAFPDLLLLDINMPRMNGLQVLEQIKREKPLSALPVIVLTNSIRSKDMQEAYARQASGFIQKNSDLMGFYEDIDRLLQYWCRTVILPGTAA